MWQEIEGKFLMNREQPSLPEQGERSFLRLNLINHLYSEWK